MGGDHAGKGGRQHQDHQPGDALFGVGPHAGAKVGGGLVVGEDGRHFLHIFGGFFGQDVDGVVDGDDAHEHPFVVQDRHGGEVVALHLTGDELLVVGDPHRDDVFVHDLGDGGIQLGQQQAADRHDAQQAVFVHHVAGIEGLGLFALLADGRKRLLDVHFLAQADIFQGHQAAGRIFGVVQQLVQAFAGLGGGFFQHPLDHPRGHVFQQVGGVVQAHLLDGGDELHVGELIHQLVPGVVGHIGENLGGHFLFQQAEHHQAVVFVQFFQQLGQVGGLHILGHFPQLDILLFHQQFQQAALGQFVGGRRGLPGFLFFGVPHVLPQVLGGLLVVQVPGQLFPDFGGDVRRQLLGGHLFQMLIQMPVQALPGVLAEDVFLLLFHGSIPPQCVIAGGYSPSQDKKGAACGRGCLRPAKLRLHLSPCAYTGTGDTRRLPSHSPPKRQLPARSRGAAACFSVIQPSGR